MAIVSAPARTGTLPAAESDPALEHMTHVSPARHRDTRKEIADEGDGSRSHWHRSPAGSFAHLIGSRFAPRDDRPAIPDYDPQRLTVAGGLVSPWSAIRSPTRKPEASFCHFDSSSEPLACPSSRSYVAAEPLSKGARAPPIDSHPTAWRRSRMSTRAAAPIESARNHSRLGSG